MTKDFTIIPSPLVRGSRRAASEDRMDWPDALRGWAILGVMMVHCSQIFPDLVGPVRVMADGGQYGVQLFFIVSALTICLTYGRAVGDNPMPVVETLGWYARRFFRIAPLYYYGVGLYALIFYGMTHLGSHLEIPSPVAYLCNLLFIHTWVPVAQNDVVPGGWSIGVEMFFYGVVPFVFLKLDRPVWLIAAFIGVILCAEVGAGALREAVDPDEADFLYYWFPTQLPVFLAGMILYRLAGDRLWRNRTLGDRVELVCALAFVPLIVLGLYLGNYAYFDTILSAPIFGIAFCCLVVMAKGRLGKVLVNFVTMTLGRVSYSVYINHFIFIFLIRAISKRTDWLAGIAPPVKLAGAFLCVSVLAFVLSLLTYRLIEAPGIAFGRRWAKAIVAAD